MRNRIVRVGWSAWFILGAVACTQSAGDGSPSFVRWPVGLHVTGQGTYEALTKAYKQVAGGGAVEQKGTIQAGEFAGESSGTFERKQTFTRTSDWLVVGETRSNNPLVPGWDAFGEVPVALVEATDVRKDIQTYTREVSVSEKPAGQKHAVQTEDIGVQDRVTHAESFGLAGDEYLVRLNDLSLVWDPRWELWETFWRQDKGGCEGLAAASEFEKLMASLTYLGRTGPGVGDVWVHPDGHTIYRAVAKEPVDIGGRTVTAVKVELREVSNVDSTDILGRCIHEQVEGEVEWTTQGTPSPDEGDHRLPRLHKDPGCEGDFVHRKVGHEWWYANVLVKEEATYYRVKIQDFGYEWLEWQGGKVLRTSQVKTSNAASAGARPFVQFTYTTEKVAWQVTGWQTLDFEAY